MKTGNAKIVQHLATLMVGDALDDLRVDDHRAKRDQVGRILVNLDRLVEDRESRLLGEGIFSRPNSTTSSFS